MATAGKVVHVDFRQRVRAPASDTTNPLVVLATKISEHLVTRAEVETILDSVAAGIRSAPLPATPKGKGSSYRERIAVSICRAGARHPTQRLDIKLPSRKADEVSATEEAKALRDTRNHYRSLLATACLTEDAIPDAKTISGTIEHLKTNWREIRKKLLGSEAFQILARYLPVGNLRRLVPDSLIDGDPTAVIDDLCQTYAFYKHIHDHVRPTLKHRDELVACQDVLNHIVERIPTVVFDGTPPKQAQPIQKELARIKLVLQKIADDVTPGTTPGNFGTLLRARKVNEAVRTDTKSGVDGEAAAIIRKAEILVERIERDFAHSTPLYTKLKAWPTEMEAALIEYLAEKYKLSGPIRAKFAKTLSKKAASTVA